MHEPKPSTYFLRILDDLWKTGRECKPRGLVCKELRDYTYVLPPRVRFVSFDHRRLKLDYIKQEFLWYLRGDKRDVSIRHLAKMWDGLINPDGTINSNYGYYIFNVEAGGGVVSNFYRVVQELHADPESRRATISILSNEHFTKPTSDYPCTSYLNFHIRENRLYMYVRMRSQDAIFGMGNDAPCFSLIHELLWSCLRKYYPTLELGDYHHNADSFHVYERHYGMIQRIIEDPMVIDDMHKDCPLMEPTPRQYVELSKVAHCPKQFIRDQEVMMPFTRWLLERDEPLTLLNKEEIGL